MTSSKLVFTLNYLAKNSLFSRISSIELDWVRSGLQLTFYPPKHTKPAINIQEIKFFETEAKSEQRNRNIEKALINS